MALSLFNPFPLLLQLKRDPALDMVESTTEYDEEEDAKEDDKE
jgi:hypothetical protein